MRKKYLIVILLSFTALTIVYFGFRGAVLRYALTKIIAQAEASLHVKVSYGNTGFVGFKRIYISKLEVTSPTGEMLVHSDSLIVNPRILPLLTGKKRLREMDVYNGNVRLSNDLLKLLRSHRNVEDSAAISHETDYTKIVNSLQNKLFTYIPSRVVIRNAGFTYQNDSISSSLLCENFSYEGNNFLGELIFSDNQQKSHCMITGSLNKSDHKLTAVLNQTDTATVRLPFLNSLWQTNIGFDTVKLSVTFDEVRKGLTNIVGFATANNFSIKHVRIGPDVVAAKNSGINFTLHVGQKTVELDSSSTVTVNKFSFSPYFKYNHNSSRSITFSFIRKEFDAQELFESLPTGLFTNFSRIKTSGKLAYHLNIGIDLDHPDSVIFDSQLENKGFKIDKYGVTDFRMLNGSFIQDVYEKDRYVTSILVGPDNADFVPLDQISSYFKYSVLTAEDGDFYYHHGFNERAFRESIATNLKEKRFARGGSTISMQLVKNVFLSRNKTISRKIEEALIVWIIENLHLVSKDRMFEVYLNIIELGPGVYGIKPASRFYFKKSPANLNLTESIYLSSIIPRPKGFRYTFDENGQLRDYLTGYFKLLSGIMVKRNQIAPTDTMNMKPNIKLTGEARKFLAKPDSIAREDSLFFKEFVSGKPIMLNEE